MILQVLVVRDRSADAFGQPTYATSVGSAVRAFSDEVNRVHEHNVMNKHPEDFDLFHIGEYDDSSAEFQLNKPRQVAVGKDCVQKSR